MDWYGVVISGSHVTYAYRAPFRFSAPAARPPRRPARRGGDGSPVLMVGRLPPPIGSVNRPLPLVASVDMAEDEGRDEARPDEEGRLGARFAAMAVLATAIVTGHGSIALLYAVLFVINTGEIVFRAASQAMIPAVVPRARLERANGWLTGGTTCPRPPGGSSTGPRSPRPTRSRCPRQAADAPPCSEEC